MNLIREAFSRIYPNKEFNYNVEIKYSGRFSDYNANVKYYGKSMVFNLSKKWKGVNREIVIGLIQSLMLKVFKEKRTKTMNIDLYNNFIKSLHYTIRNDKNNPILEASFNRVNDKYFDDLIQRPNLIWGGMTYRKLGSYDFQTDTISISKVFCDKERELLDYVMYHEMLHKKHKFKDTGSRNIFHSKEFKKDEKGFENANEIENKLKYLNRKRKKKRFSFFKLYKKF
ncbi:SprT-like domain-containing protein [Candidatus Woesearchaeota archaeon]|nr:SprT-like domain-containing protein [Candidatus Woesearchaeota archaeon]